jgi:Leucine-rich repeat (LRR) protein
VTAHTKNAQSYNKLDNACFDVISQITSLRDLKVRNNDLAGDLSAGVAKLHNLEVLDIQHNRLTSLPEALADLVRLRVLNISGNGFTSLPFETLHRLPLIELSAVKNKLKGVLIEIQDAELPQLQVLDVSGNSLSSLALDHLRLPALHQLSCAANRLTSLPDMTSWQSLLTLAAEDNNISSIPEGFTELAKIKNVDLTGNNIKVLDDRIGRMESLDIFRISGNPLREKKFSSMTAEDLKRALSARLAPPEIEGFQEESSEVFTSCPSSPTQPNSSSWPVKAGGVLDRSNTQSLSLDPVIAAETAANNTVRVLDLRHNLFKEIPSPITLFASTLTTLILSHNELANDTFLDDDLELPSLKELNLSSNTFTSLHPLTTHLHAPSLEKLDISFNRLPSLPILRSFFPQLTILLASNNSIKELHPEAVKGLKVLDCSSNDIESLNARIGLLGGPGGLERLDVSGNRFRVPKYTVLEKGTEATLKWLRDRIPVGDGLDLDVD